MKFQQFFTEDPQIQKNHAVSQLRFLEHWRQYYLILLDAAERKARTQEERHAPTRKNGTDYSLSSSL